MSDELRLVILDLLDKHSRTGSPNYLEDQQLSNATNESIEEIQRQLDILESQDLVELAKTFGPNYGARISPKGTLLIERARESAKQDKKRPIGFGQNEGEGS